MTSPPSGAFWSHALQGGCKSFFNPHFVIRDAGSARGLQASRPPARSDVGSSKAHWRRPTCQKVQVMTGLATGGQRAEVRCPLFFRPSPHIRCRRDAAPRAEGRHSPAPGRRHLPAPERCAARVGKPPRTAPKSRIALRQRGGACLFLPCGAETKLKKRTLFPEKPPAFPPRVAFSDIFHRRPRNFPCVMPHHPL